MSLTPPPSGECHPGNPKTLSTTPPYPKPTRTASPFGTAVPQTHPSPISPLAPPYPKPAPLPRTSPPTSPLLPNPLYNLSFLLSQCRLANTHRPSVPDSLSAGGNEPLPARRRAAAAPPGPPFVLCYGAADPPVLCYGAAPTSPHLGGSNTQTTSGEMRLLTPTRSCPGCDFWSGAPQIPAFFLGLFFPPFFFRTSYFFQPADKKKKKRHFLR